jgi:hypothetical protein
MEREAVWDVGRVRVDDLDVRGVAGEARCVAGAFGAAVRAVGEESVDRRGGRQRSVRCVAHRGEQQHGGDGEKNDAGGQSAVDGAKSTRAHPVMQD